MMSRHVLSMNDTVTYRSVQYVFTVDYCIKVLLIVLTNGKMIKL
jgi:hypothetical protein